MTDRVRQRCAVAARPSLAEHLTFHEYFHGDDGAGLGASHQTGWTALVAVLIIERIRTDPP